MAVKPKLALIPSGYKAGKVYSVLPVDGVGDFDFSRYTTPTRINKYGLIETVDSNVPRLNYPLIDGVVSGCPSLLLENSATNFIAYSEDFSNVWWSKIGTSIVSNSTISPDGSLNASKIVEDTSNGTHILYKNNVVTGAGKNTLSVKVKANGRNWIFLYDAEQGEAAYFDLENGVAGSTIGSPDDYSITALPNGWYDISLTTTATLRVDFQVYLAESDGNNSYQGDGESGIYVWGAQLELGSYPTSYIPSLIGSATTRSAETCNNAGDVNTFNDSEGVLMAEISALANDGTNRRIAISDGTNSNRLFLAYTSVSNELIAINVSDNTTSVLISTSISVLQSNKIVFKYKQNDFSLWVNGFKIGIDTSANTPIGLNTLRFEDGNGGNDFYGNTKQLQYFDTALTDTDLEQLTSWTSFNEIATSQLYTIL